MIYEVAVIRVMTGTERDFEIAVQQAAEIFRTAPGCRRMRLYRQVEEPLCYHLVVGWDSVEHHTQGFRNSPSFAEWRTLASPFFAEPPMVRHVTLSLVAF